MDTYVDLEAQVLRDGQPFTRPTRWAHGLASFGDKPEPSHWKLYPGATNLDSREVVAYVQFMGWVTHETTHTPPQQWALIRAQISIDGIVWPQALPGQLWVPPTTITAVEARYMTEYAEYLSHYGGWTCAIHFDALSNMDRLTGVHTLLLRALREEAP